MDANLSAGPSNFAHHLGKIASAAAWFVNARAVTAAPVTFTVPVSNTRGEDCS